MYKDVLFLLIMTDNIKYVQQTEKLSKISAKTRISKQLQQKRIHVHENQAFFVVVVISVFLLYKMSTMNMLKKKTL